MESFGKQLKMIRIRNDHRLLDAARLLDKSVAYLSAIERGDRQPPQGFAEEIIRQYRLSDSAASDLRRAFAAARTSFELRPTTPMGLDTASMLARRFNELDETMLMRIRQILDVEEDEDE